MAVGALDKLGEDNKVGEKTAGEHKQAIKDL